MHLNVSSLWYQMANPTEFRTSAYVATILIGVLLVAGCTSTRMAQIDPSDAPTRLEKGDKIEITRSDGEFVALEVVEVTTTEVVGEDARVPIDDIVAITKFVRGTYDPVNPSTGESEAEYIWGLVGAVLVLALIL